MEKEIIIKPSFTFKDYFKANFYILSNKFSMYFLAIIYSFFIFSILISLIFGSKDEISALFPSCLSFFIFPAIFMFLIYSKTKAEITNNYRLKENINYILNKEHFLQKGESFETKHKWENILKIKETKKWFLLFVSKNTALLIQKKDLKDNQYNELKQLFNSIDIKKSLKS